MELVQYYDEHPELQEEILANTLKWWNKDLHDLPGEESNNNR